MSRGSEPVWCVVDAERWQPASRLIKDIDNEEGVVRYRPRGQEEYVAWVRVGPSAYLAKQVETQAQDAGDGMYAMRKFRRGEVVLTYVGKPIGRADEVGDEVRRMGERGEGRHIYRVGGEQTGIETDAQGYIAGCMNCALDDERLNNVIMRGGSNGTLWWRAGT